MPKKKSPKNKFFIVSTTLHLLSFLAIVALAYSFYHVYQQNHHLWVEQANFDIDVLNALKSLSEPAAKMPPI